MSVIAKMSIRAVSRFGHGSLTELGCVCANDLMAQSAGSEEDKLFTKASPWGEAKLSGPDGFQLGKPADGFGDGTTFYFVVVWADEAPADPEKLNAFNGATLAFKGRCASLLDLGYSKTVEFAADRQADRGVDRFAWKMMVDNPGAYEQFKPGADCWIALYPVERFDRNQAIAAALGVR